MEQKFYLEKLNDGKWRNFDTLLKALDGLSHGRWVISLSKYKKKRSLSQNAYYFGCVVPAVRDGLIGNGYEPYLLTYEVVHDFLKEKFLKRDIGNNEGEFISVTLSTTALSTVDFMAYIDDIQKWAAEFLGIVILNPGEQTQIF